MNENTPMNPILPNKLLAYLYACVVIPIVLLAEQAYVFWHAESYYNYGWAIPVLFVYLFYSRLQDLPKAEASQGVINSSLALLGCCGFVVFRLIAEAFAPWRTSLWAEGFCVILLLFAVLGFIGGKAWQKHFSYTLLFGLFLLPWPFRLEFYSVSYLTDWVMLVTVKLLSYIGEDVQQYGNIVHVGDTQVGVEEACSGIRSLQSLFMCAVFLGEMFRMRLWLRITMLVVSLVIVLIVNSIRSFVLSIITIAGGTEAYTTWHDPVGNIFFLISIVLMYFIFRSSFKDPEEAPQRADFNYDLLLKRFKAPLLVLAFLSVGSALIESYFIFAKKYVQEPKYLALKDLSEEISWNENEYSEVIQRKLDFDYGACYRHYEPGKTKTDLYYYGYDSEKSESSLVSLVHQPSVCMTMSGWHYQKGDSMRSISINVDGDLVPFNHHIFEKTYKGTTLVSNVFFTSYDPVFGESFSNFFEENWKDKLTTIYRRVKLGRRDLTRQVILLGLSEEDPGVAKSLAEKLIYESAKIEKSL